MANEFGVDPYGAPDGKFRSYGSAEARRPNGQTIIERTTGGRKENILVVPIGVKRFVPKFAQGRDVYGAPDPKLGGYTFDPRSARRTMV